MDNQEGTNNFHGPRITPPRQATADRPTSYEMSIAGKLLADYPAVPAETLAGFATEYRLPGIASAALSLSGVTDASVAAILRASGR